MNLGCLIIALKLLTLTLIAGENIHSNSLNGSVKLQDLSKAFTGKIFLTGDNESYTAFISPKGAFKFDNIPDGSYLMEVFIVGYVFHQVHVEVTSSQFGTRVEAREVFKKGQIPYPFVLESHQTAKYFMIRPPFQFTSFLKNPMVLIMGFTFLMAFILPKMMDNMDPKELEEMKNMQSKMSLSNALASGK